MKNSMPAPRRKQAGMTRLRDGIRAYCAIVQNAPFANYFSTFVDKNRRVQRDQRTRSSSPNARRLRKELLQSLFPLVLRTSRGFAALWSKCSGFRITGSILMMRRLASVLRNILLHSILKRLAFQPVCFSLFQTFPPSQTPTRFEIVSVQAVLHADIYRDAIGRLHGADAVRRVGQGADGS
eukprot:scaffold7615_cov286-Pinguiococcus_pyrenoidosus.AAC.3